MQLLHQLGWSALKQQIRRQFPQVRQISTDELAVWLEDSDTLPPLLLDVRWTEEYAVSHLKSAQPIAPDRQTFPELKHLPPQTPIVTYCSVGYRSARLADRLQAAGFTHVRNLEGSIFEWANQGKPLYCDGQAVAQVHPYSALWGMLLHPSRRAPL